jgi:hypothetical protein
VCVRGAIRNPGVVVVWFPERHTGHAKQRHASRRKQSISSSRLDTRMLSCVLVGGEVPEDTLVFKTSTRAVWT